MTNILFVCLGNICRSPAAEGIFKHIVSLNMLDDHPYLIDSAGTYGGHAGDLPDLRMRQAAKRRGYELNHRSRRITTDDFINFDLIITMDDANYENCYRLAPSVEASRKIYRMTDFCTRHKVDHIPDPYYEGVQGFERVLDLLEDACQGLFNHTKNINK